MKNNFIDSIPDKQIKWAAKWLVRIIAILLFNSAFPKLTAVFVGIWLLNLAKKIKIK